MHAAYLFLINDDYNDDHYIGENLTDYLENQTDENNWYQLCIKVRENGEVVQLCESGDWRGRDGWYDEYEKMPSAERFPAIVKLAKGCVYNEIESGLHVITQDYKLELPEDLSIAQVIDVVNEKIREATATPHDLKDWSYWYGLECLGERVQQLRGIHTEELPFTADEENPYRSIRAIDFRGSQYVKETNEILYDPRNLAVVLVDIHT